MRLVNLVTVSLSFFCGLTLHCCLSKIIGVFFFGKLLVVFEMGVFPPSFPPLQTATCSTGVSQEGVHPVHAHTCSSCQGIPPPQKKKNLFNLTLSNLFQIGDSDEQFVFNLIQDETQQQQQQQQLQLQTAADPLLAAAGSPLQQLQLKQEPQEPSEGELAVKKSCGQIWGGGGERENRYFKLKVHRYFQKPRN